MSNVKRQVTIALLDVDYRVSSARAACVVADSWASESPSATYSTDIASVQEYEPGNFYRRELPCLLEVLKSLPHPAAIVVIDGYVWLADESRPGLGAHLYAALESRVPVVGIAKTAYIGAESSAAVAKVIRGTSLKPLFVTAAGVELAAASQWVASMAGAHRIPALLTAVDRLARSSSSEARDAV